jgi:predicted dehydrogenase
MNTHKAAVIGCGKRGRGNAKTIAAIERIEPVALVDPNIEAAEAVKSEFGFDAARTYARHTEMLSAEKPEFCAICV